MFSINQTFTAAFKWKEQEITFCLLSRSSGRKELSGTSPDPLARALCILAACLSLPPSGVMAPSAPVHRLPQPRSQPGCWCSSRAAKGRGHRNIFQVELWFPLPLTQDMKRVLTQIQIWRGVLLRPFAPAWCHIFRLFLSSEDQPREVTLPCAFLALLSLISLGIIFLISRWDFPVLCVPCLPCTSRKRAAVFSL